MVGISRFVCKPCAKNTGVTIIFFTPVDANLLKAEGMLGSANSMKPTSILYSGFVSEYLAAIACTTSLL